MCRELNHPVTQVTEESPKGIKYNTEEYNVNVLIDWQIKETLLTVEYVCLN